MWTCVINPKPQTPNRGTNQFSESGVEGVRFFCFCCLVFFPTCQVRVVRFYKNCPSLLPSSFLLLARPQPKSLLARPQPKRLHHSQLRLVFTAGPQPQPSTPSVPCRTSTTAIHAQCSLPDPTTAIHAQCSLPDLNHSHPRPVFAAGPQPQPSTPSVRCRTSTTAIHAQCSLPDLNHSHPRPVFAAGPQPQPSTPSVRCRTSTTAISRQCSLPDLNHNVSCISMNVFSLRLVQSLEKLVYGGQRHCHCFSSAAVNKDARDRQHPTARDSHDSF